MYCVFQWKRLLLMNRNRNEKYKIENKTIEKQEKNNKQKNKRKIIENKK